MAITLSEKKVSELLFGGNHPQPDYTTFTPFPRLPKELRLDIWELALPGARLINMGSSDCRVYPHCHTNLPPNQHTLCEHLNLLSVNKESRTVALQRYLFFKGPNPDSLLPENPVQNEDSLDENPKEIYVAPAIDLLCFHHDDEFMRYMSERKFETYDGAACVERIVIFRSEDHRRVSVDDIKHWLAACVFAKSIFNDLAEVLFVLDAKDISKVPAKDMINSTRKVRFGRTTNTEAELNFITEEQVMAQFGLQGF